MYDKAEKMLYECLRRDPKRLAAHYYLGDVYERRGTLLRAEQHYRKNFEISPDCIATSIALTNVRAKIEKRDKFISDIKRLFGISGRDEN